MAVIDIKAPRERKPGPYKAGRSCEDCGASLSRYNPSSHCAPCSGGDWIPGDPTPAQVEGAEKIGTLAAEFMEQIEHSDVADGCTAQIRTVALVVEIDVDEEDGPGFTGIRTRCSEPRRWVQIGLLEAGKCWIENDRGEASEDEEEE